MAENKKIKWVKMNQWEIIDSKGVIFSGTEDEVLPQWEEMVNGDSNLYWTGDIKLVQVHGIHK